LAPTNLLCDRYSTAAVVDSVRILIEYLGSDRQGGDRLLLAPYSPKRIESTSTANREQPGLRAAGGTFAVDQRERAKQAFIKDVFSRISVA